MKEEADKLRARAAAGEDFVKLQQDAYDFAGQKLKAQADSVRVNNVSKGHFPPSDASVFDLKVGEVSPVLNNSQGFMIYKIEAKQPQPMADVRNDIVRILQQQKLQQASQDLQKTATENTTYDDAYFAVPAAPSLRNPGEAPSPSPAPTGTPAPGKK
jgi:parvulin-like peptidyl-prolyl isomerase